VTPDEIIAEWSRQYERANGFPPKPAMHYERGWYAVQFSKYRKAKVIEMTETLRRRADNA
jgi:hypothetical protein